jgi:RHS repeat-associated protein
VLAATVFAPEEVSVSRIAQLIQAFRLKAGSQGSAMSRKAVWLAGMMGVAVLALPATASAAACGNTWGGPAEGSWGTPANWSAGHVPTSSEVACIGSGVTVEASFANYQVGVVQGEGSLVVYAGTFEVTDALEPSVIGSLTMKYEAVLTGAATVEVLGSLSWGAASTMSGTGMTVVESGALGSVSSSVDLVGRTFINDGTLTYAGGSLVMSEGAQLDNSGTFDATAEGAAFANGDKGAAPLVVNTGTFEKTENTERTKVEVDFENSGKITTTTGRFAFGGSEVAVTLANGSVLEGTEVFDQAAVTAGDFKAPAGKVTLEYGSLDIAEGDTATINNFTMNFNAEVKGAGTLELPEDFTWALGSTMSGSGTTVVESGASASVVGAEARLVGRKFVNEGTFTLESGEMRMTDGARFENNGTFNANAEGTFDMYTNNESTAPLFVNTGTFQKTAGTGQTNVEFPFENIGVVDAKTGKIGFLKTEALVYFAKGSILEGSIVIDAAQVNAGSFKATGTVTLEYSVLAVEAGSTATIADFIMNNGCEVAGAGTLAISESFSWDVQSKMSGTGATVIEPGATGSITVGGATAKIIERDLVNEGTFTWAEGELAMSYGARLENRGTFDANSENAQGIFEPENEREGAAPLVVNSGTFQKTKGTGETKVEVDFENLGSILQPTGKLLIKHPVTAESSTQYGGKNESALGPPPPGCGDPIDCATGNFYESQTDLAVGGRGIGLTLTRTYNSQAAAAGASGTFGSGWSSPFSDYLTVGQGKTTLTQANGSTVPFTEGKGEAFTPRAWSQDTLSGNSKAGYSLVLPNQLKYQFEGATGRLQSVSDRNGNQTKLGYGKTGLLETITDPSGRKITLTYNKEGLVESAKDPTGHTAKYEYEEGNLKSVTLPGETKARWQYHYGEAHQMTLMIDGRKGETTNEYNAAHQLTSQTDPAGHKLKFEYEPFHTKITSNTTGAVTDEHFTSNNKPYSITHGFGTSSASTETLTYDADGDLTSVTDGNGHKASYTYENGNKTSMVNADKDETKWTYDGTHDVLTVTTPNGEKTTITRNSDGDAETVSRPAPGNTTQTTTYHYDEHGNLTSVVDPLKHTWSYEYDPAGDRTSETDPEGDKRTYDYNEDSQETSTVSPGGNVKGAEASQYTTKIERDQQGRPTLITDPLGHTTKYVYDGNGNIETMTDGDGNTTTYTYDADNEPTKVKEPNGDVTETGYDGAERVTSQTDGNKHTTTYVRNVLGEVTEIKDPLGRVTKKECDAAGNLTAVIDAAGRTTKYAYDPANRLKEISYSESKTPTVKYEYDADGNRVKMVDGTGTTTYTYDILDRLIKSTNGRGVATGYEYNIGDEQVKLTYPNNDPLTRAYDNAGRLQSATDWSGNTTTFAYNPDSDLSTITYPKGTGEQDKMTYNGADQELKITMTGSGLKVLASLAYTRDGNGQVKTTTTTGLPGTASISDTYDANNRLGKSGSTTYAYDAADEPTTLGSNTSVYDAAGELKASGSDIYGYDQVGDRGSATPKEGQATAYGYNQAGDLIQVKQGKTSGLNDTYAYNGDGLRTSQSKGKGTSYVTWDNQVELPLILNDEQNSYVYGPDNIPIEEIQSKGVVLYLHHDQQGSTRMLTSATGAVEATTTYDAYGNVTGTTGTATTPLGYDGQYTDTDTGLIYMRARAYDPATAQFLRVDPLVGLTRAPYDYAEDNPLTESDPSGLCGVSSLGEFGDCFNPVSSGNLAYEGAEELSSATDGTINLPSLLIRPPVIDAGALIVCAVPYSDFACPEALGAAWSDSTSSVIATGIETNWCEPTKLAAEEAVNSLLLSFGGLGVYAAQAAAEQGATRLALALIRGTPLTIQGILDAALAKHSG